MLDVWELDGLPVHVLLVHALVVLVPTASAAVVAAGWSARARRRLGLLPPALALLAVGLTPVTASAGEWLQDRLPPAPLVEEHADLGEGLLPWVLGLLLVASAVHLVGRRTDAAEAEVPTPDRRLHGARGLVALPVVVAVLATLVAAGATATTFRVGESGARAVWQGSVQP